jgi:anti-sigma B factor antagonist
MAPTSPETQDAGSDRPVSNEAASTQPQDSGHRRPRFGMDVTRTARTAVITLTGEFDVVCADAFKRRLADSIEDEPPHVVLDLRPLTFIDSTGLAMLLRVNEMAADQDFALWVVSGPDDPPAKIFRMTGTNTILPLVDEPPNFSASSA